LNIAIQSSIDANFVSSPMIVDYVRVYQSAAIGIEESSRGKSKFYPNPTEGTAKIHHDLGEATLSIFTNTGLKVIEIEDYESGAEINISQLSSGIYSYVLKGSTYNSQATFVKR